MQRCAARVSGPMSRLSVARCSGRMWRTHSTSRGRSLKKRTTSSRMGACCVELYMALKTMVTLK
eukprot:IDg17719t1